MAIDRKAYHPKWSLISHLVRFVRAKGVCEAEGCNARHMEAHPTEGYLVKLATAHLDHDIGNNRFWNLRAYCQTHHLGYDRIDNADRRRYGPTGRHHNQAHLFEKKPVTAKPTKSLIEQRRKRQRPRSTPKRRKTAPIAIGTYPIAFAHN